MIYGNKFATTESEIVEMGLRLAGAGEQVGLSEAEILGLATALSSVGIEAEMGGSAISKAMVKMQNAVEVGGGKLNDVLKKSNMSLRELEMLSANDSKSFRELSQTLGLTSTELKRMVTSGVELENFAKISGLSVEQFKTQWGTGAVGALSAFIQGLGNAEEKGESAIVMLSEMGLSEVRLRDSLLRAANAGDLFTNAIDTGTKAWGENIALSKEAEQRYATTESQMAMLKNEVVALGIDLGDELAPSLRQIFKDVKPVIKGAGDLIKSFSKLDTNTKQNTIKIIAFGVALGPIVKTTGSLVKGFGSLVTVGGNYIKKIGEMSIATKLQSVAMKTQATTTTATTTATTGQTIATTAQAGATNIATASTVALKVAMLALPLVAIATGVIAVVSAVKKWSEANDETKAKYKELTQVAKEQQETRNDIIEQQKEQVNGNLAEIENTERLIAELRTLVDENGKVKEGYQGRVDFILGELNKALDTEYKSVDGIVQKYGELQESIDSVVAKKKAKIILDSQEEAYTNAIKSKAEAEKTLLGLEEQVLDAQEKQRLKEIELSQAIKDGATSRITSLGLEVQNLSKTTTEKQEEYNNQKGTVEGYYNDIATYEDNARLYAEGTAESIAQINASTVKSYADRKDATKEQLIQEINEVSLSLQTLRKVHEENQSDVTKNQIEEEEKRLQNLKDNLVNQTDTVDLNTSLPQAWDGLSQRSLTELGKNDDKFKTAGEEKSKKVAEGMEQQENTIKEATNYSILGTIENAIEKNDGSSWGRLLVEGLIWGIKKQLGPLASLGDWIMGKIFSNATQNSQGQSEIPGHEDGLDYVPYDNYVARLHKGERVLTREENMEYSKDSIPSSKMQRSGNITVNFYADHINDAEMARVERRINRVWRDKYV